MRRLALLLACAAVLLVAPGCIDLSCSDRTDPHHRRPHHRAEAPEQTEAVKADPARNIP